MTVSLDGKEIQTRHILAAWAYSDKEVRIKFVGDTVGKDHEPFHSVKFDTTEERDEKLAEIIQDMKKPG